jgi:CxxC motif-containing protein (DUF1111 family)
VNPLFPVTALFVAADAKNPPIVFKREDGALVTRAAGRFRGRHEKEGSFGLYYKNSFLDPGFGLTFEDFTPVGQQRIRVTYLPSYKLMNERELQTNFRHWKIQGNNATFALNDFMVTIAAPPVEATAAYGGVQQYDDTRVPEGRTMTAGESYEVEFGAFLPTYPDGRRNSYYTDTFRYRIGLGGLTPNNRDYEPLAGPLLNAQLGGDTTLSWLVAEPYAYFDQMALNTQHENLQKFLEGRRMFYTDFTTGSHLEEGNFEWPEQAGKAGPLANATSCVACHFRNSGGARVTETTVERGAFVIKLFDAGALGGQLQPQEGTVTLTNMDTKDIVLFDGTKVTLQRPRLAVGTINASVTRFSARVARPLVGLGLLEAIDEQALLALSDPLDCDKDGISGRPNLVKDTATNTLRVGRFGWKAEKFSVAHQIADDATASMGVTTYLTRDEQGKQELTDTDLLKLLTYMRLIGVPPQRKAADPEVRDGAKVFQAIGCAACHRTDLLTGPNHSFSELRNQAIRPFTDLLLHDMGPDLADESGFASSLAGDPAASSEWRTPPLWGVGLAKIVNPTATFLHDGRAANVQEAILWHGGEAEKSKALYVNLSTTDRKALLAFLESL